MNTVLLELNSYAQEARLLVNGRQPSEYSELSDYTYEQMLNSFHSVLDAIGREINDDFDLLVTANAYEYHRLEQAAKENEYCASCHPVPAKVSMTSGQRAEALGDLLPTAHFTAAAPAANNLPKDTRYGNITVSFTADRSGHADVVLDVSDDLLLSACETLLVNPHIGRTVAAQKNCPKELAICARLNPILSVSMPEHMEAGDSIGLSVEVYPEDAEMPGISITSNNPEVLSAKGTMLKAHSSGTVEVQVALAGDIKPFYRQQVEVSKSVYVSKIEVKNLGDFLHEGKTLNLDAAVYPADAVDADRIVFETSDPKVAEIKDGKLKLKAAGPCVITVKTDKACYVKNVQVLPVATRLSISKKKYELTVGQKDPVSISISPHNAYNKDCSWSSTDSTVAVVVKENGKEFVKAVGIGSCTLTCSTPGNTASDTCSVHVNSMMYKRSTADYKRYLIFAVVFLFFFVRGCFGGGNDNDTKPKEPVVYKNATYIDAFEELECYFYGENTKGQAKVSNPSKNPFVQGCNFYVSPSSSLSNGQEVTVSISFDDSIVETYGYAPKEQTKTITVSGLPTYVETYQQIPEEFIEEAKERQTAWLQEREDEIAKIVNGKAGTAKCFGVYFQDVQHSTSNQLIVVVGTENYNNDGTLQSATYVGRTYKNIGLDEKGNVTDQHNNVSGVLASGYGSLDALIADLYADSNCITVEVP